MNRTSYFSQNPSFKEFGVSANMRNETDYLLAPEHRSVFYTHLSTSVHLFLAKCTDM